MKYKKKNPDDCCKLSVIKNRYKILQIANNKSKGLKELENESLIKIFWTIKTQKICLELTI